MRRILTLVVLLALGVAVFGRRIAWRPTEKPSVTIIAAVETATKELNKDGGDFYCLGGRIAKTFSDCDWELQFCNTAGERRVVSVGSDHKLNISNHGFEY